MRNRCKSLRAEQLQSTYENLPFDINQSLPANSDNFRPYSVCSSVTISKWNNKSALCLRDSFGSASSLSSLIENSHGSVIGNKAVFTISLPSTQILIVNATASQLLDFSSDDLCLKRLDSLLNDGALLHSLIESESCFDLCSGILVELLGKGGPVPVFLQAKKINSNDRCCVIAEVVDKRTGIISITKGGVIHSADEDASYIFLQESKEMIGMPISNFIPNFPLYQTDKLTKQYCTGKSKFNSFFPLCIKNVNNTVLNSILFEVTAFSGLPLPIVLNKEFLIIDCNELAMLTTFGLAKSSSLHKPINELIPDFAKNMDTEQSSWDCGEPKVSKRFQADRKALSRSVNSAIQSRITTQFNSLNESDFQFKVWTSNSSLLHGSQSDDVLTKSQCSNRPNALCSTTSNYDLKMDVGFPINRAFNVSNLSGLDRNVREGCFHGLAKHTDGNLFEVFYQINKVFRGNSTKEYDIHLCIHEKSMWDFTECQAPTLLSSSVDEPIHKDSISSRPNSVSLISQCDEVLTEGDYSKYYTNLQEVGKGAFGYVKTAYRNDDGFLVVTKFIKKQKIRPHQIVFDPDLNMNVPLEVSMLLVLDHPNVIRILDVYENDQFYQMVMERHGAGMDLFSFLDRRPNMNEKLMSHIFRQIVSALDYLHSLGIIHRDIKDENIIIDHVFHVKLIDFGSAAFMVSGKKLFSTFYGTVEYCSPEVLQGNKYRGPELEMWSLGVTLYVLVFGENPFQRVEEIVQGEFRILWPISSQLQSLLHGLIEKNVELRWDIKKVVSDPWVNQEVNVSSFVFEEVVQCYKDEANPARYVSELWDDDEDNQTIASSSSFSSLHTIENEIDLPVQGDSADPAKCIFGKKNVLSSTPRSKLGSSENLKPTDRPAQNCLKRFSLDISNLRRLYTENASDKKPSLSSEFNNLHLACDSLKNGVLLKHCDDDQFWDAED